MSRGERAETGFISRDLDIPVGRYLPVQPVALRLPHEEAETTVALLQSDHGLHAFCYCKSDFVTNFFRFFPFNFFFFGVAQ
jgi:hypothetical protein